MTYVVMGGGGVKLADGMLHLLLLLSYVDHQLRLSTYTKVEFLKLIKGLMHLLL